MTAPKQRAYDPRLHGLLLLCVMTAPQALQPFRVVVRTLDGPPVVYEDVFIDGDGKYQTSESGQFEFPPSRYLEVDSEAVFHVNRWVVIRPCDGKNGRTFLPPPRRLTEIKVLSR